MKKIAEKRLSYILCLTIIYILTHCFLLLLSGRWWDDYCLWMYDMDRIRRMMVELGRPIWYYFFEFGKIIPRDGYRYVVFLLYYISSIMIYKILTNTGMYGQEECFWISALYITIPINDARVLLSCFGYAIANCVFWVAFCLTTYLTHKQGLCKGIIRVLVLALFCISFWTESFLVYFGIVILYLCYSDFKHTGNRLKLKSLLYWGVHNLDFIIAPLAFYIIKKCFFSSNGVYKNYNVVTGQTVIGAFMKLPRCSWETLANIVRSYKVQIGLSFGGLWILGTLLFVFVSRRDSGHGNKNISKLFLGPVLFMAGLFPYTVVRAKGLYNTGVGGRDTLLLGVGMAMLIYYGFRSIHLPKKICNICYVAFLSLGILHFNNWYLNYQEDYYQQLQFESEIAENIKIQEGNTFLCMFEQESPVGATRFYSLNANSAIVTGEMTRFFMNGPDDLQHFINFNEGFSDGYCMNDYDSSKQYLDGVILIQNASISNKELLRLKYKEIFQYDEFKEIIRKNRSIQYIPVTEAQSINIISKYQEGILSETDILNEISCGLESLNDRRR